MSNYHPSVRIRERSRTNLVLTIDKTNHSLLNSIRRVIKDEIPQLAFDMIKFKSYNGKIDEEVLAHRISLLPITCLNIDKILFRQNCKSCILGCRKCNIIFHLDKSNNDSTKAMNVYSSDLKVDKVYDSYRTEVIKFNKNEKGVLLFRLAPYESISLECTAVKGEAKEHAKYSCTNICTFQENESENENENKKTFLFSVETNGNVDALMTFKHSLQVLFDKIENMKRFLNKNETSLDFQEGVVFPFSETIMNPLQNYIDYYFPQEIDLFLYKRNHVLDTISSTLRIFSSSTTRSNKVFKDIIMNCLNYLSIDIKFLEASIVQDDKFSFSSV